MGNGQLEGVWFHPGYTEVWFIQEFESSQQAPRRKPNPKISGWECNSAIDVNNDQSVDFIVCEDEGSTSRVTDNRSKLVFVHCGVVEPDSLQKAFSEIAYDRVYNPEIPSKTLSEIQQLYRQAFSLGISRFRDFERALGSNQIGKKRYTDRGDTCIHYDLSFQTSNGVKTEIDFYELGREKQRYKAWPDLIGRPSPPIEAPVLAFGLRDDLGFRVYVDDTSRFTSIQQALGLLYREQYRVTVTGTTN